VFHRQVTIDSLIGEHIAIRGHLELIRGLNRDREKLLVSAKPTQQDYGRFKVLEDKLASLRQAMAHLEDGLKDHHHHEEDVMPPLVGELLMKAIQIEHSETLQTMGEIRSQVASTNPEDFLEKGTNLIQRIDELCSFATSHSLKEDGILLFLKKLPELK
jgi:hemerythrin